MARIHEEVIVIKLSRLVRDSDPEEVIATPEVHAALEELAGQLLKEVSGVELIVEVLDDLGVKD